MDGHLFDWVRNNTTTAVVVALVGYFVVWAAVVAVRFAVRHAHRCDHGVLGGDSLRRCAECVDLERARLRSVERSRQIAISAEELRQREQQRFKASFLSRLDGLLSLTPNEFEDAVAEMFRNLGYEVVQTPYQNDGGKDAIAQRNGKTVLIECKQYRKTAIGRPDLQKFFAAVVEEKADGGYFVCTSTFSAQAVAYAEKMGLNLVNGTRLLEMMRDAYPVQSSLTGGYAAMCLECGAVVTSASAQGHIDEQCPNGHRVSCELHLAAECLTFDSGHRQDDFNRNKRRYSHRRRRYGRRYR